MIPSPDDLQVLLHGDPERAVVELVGELNPLTAVFAFSVVEQLLAQPGATQRIELALARLERCDPAGVEVILDLQRNARVLGREIVVVEPSPAVRDALGHADDARRVAIDSV